MSIKKVCVYCASSTKCDPKYFGVARELGKELARHSITVVYGGGAVGLMGALADGALAAGGLVIGVIPDFMRQLEWQHPGVEAMHVVNDMHARKARMIAEADAFVALPGGCGTLEELLEAITWKRLALITAPVVIVNTDGFYDPLLAQLEVCVEGRFMGERHQEMWNAVPDVAGVLALLDDPPAWDGDARSFAQV